ncbi:zinc finger protein [Macleaya cordata]|uniref:Zinc finger protein n=1 Tax=Macleaya cordata TaxID=56857 RepID=A0A200QN44_MACCD|nr:zinc finger protein [Macleaya cordata]
MASAKIDNRGSFGSKRSRNDASRNGGDWTCPQCGNVNFGFRTVCNRGKCGAARPPTTPRRDSVPMPGHFDHPAPFYLGGVAAPPVPHMPPVMPSTYGPPFSLSGMRYDIGAHGNAPGPYGLLSTFPSGPVGVGMGYGPAHHAMDGYGFGFHGSPLPVPGQWSGGSMADNNASRKRRGGPDGLSEGDWICPKCDNVNFAFRTTCNMKKCGTPRPSSGPNQSDSGVPEGSWTCSKCENINYPFRTVCNRKGCGNEKPATEN